jgi:acyl transferase domain-containing protein
LGRGRGLFPHEEGLSSPFTAEKEKARGSHAGLLSLSSERPALCASVCEPMSGPTSRRFLSTLQLLLLTQKHVMALDVGLMFPPVGWQHVNMGRALREENAVFRQALEECEEVCKTAKLPRPLLSIIYPGDDDEEEDVAEMLLQTATYTMPALFAVEYALYRVFVEYGCVPSAVVGHSIGEYVAAVVAGVLDMPTALTLAVERGRAMDASMPASPDSSVGAMWALRAAPSVATTAIEQAGAGLSTTVAVAAVNGPESVVISGTHSDLQRVFEALPLGTKKTRVRASHPDHSVLMIPVAEALGTATKRLYRAAPPKPPSCLWSSCTTGELMSAASVAEDAEFAQHWARHATGTIDFPAAMRSLVVAYASSSVPSSSSSPTPKLRLVELGEGMLTRFCRDLDPHLVLAHVDETRVAVLPRAECHLDGEDRLLCTDQAADIENLIQEQIQ